MNIILTGLPRTGTSSVATALQSLGFAVTTNPFKRTRIHAAFRSDFRQFLIESDFVGSGVKGRLLWDVPVCAFFPEIARVIDHPIFINTIRDRNEWLLSMDTKILNGGPTKEYWALVDRLQRPPTTLELVTASFIYPGPFMDTPDFVKAYYEHQELLSRVNYHSVETGSGKEWQQLAKALNLKDIPEHAFPWENKGPAHYNR